MQSMSQDWMDMYNGPQNIVCYSPTQLKVPESYASAFSEIPAWATYFDNKKSCIILGSLDEQVAHGDIYS